jgi:hypothetical protein
MLEHINRNSKPATRNALVNTGADVRTHDGTSTEVLQLSLVLWQHFVQRVVYKEPRKVAADRSADTQWQQVEALRVKYSVTYVCDNGTESARTNKHTAGKDEAAEQCRAMRHMHRRSWITDKRTQTWRMQTRESR